ncbi:hypothetical protein ACN47E_001321 [Coniothyrium glycines]
MPPFPSLSTSATYMATDEHVSCPGDAGAEHAAVEGHHPRPTPRKPGPQTTRPLQDRAKARSQPAKRIQRSYPRERKIQVLQWLQDVNNYVLDHTTVKLRIREGQDWIGDLRPPTSHEAYLHFLIPASTITGWWTKREAILRQKTGTRTDRPSKKKARTAPLEQTEGVQ